MALQLDGHEERPTSVTDDMQQRTLHVPIGWDDCDIVLEQEIANPSAPPEIAHLAPVGDGAQGEEVSQPIWYVGHPSGQQEGPFTLVVLKQRLSSGKISAHHLVWREGMSSWTAVQSLPDFFDGKAIRVIPPPLPLNWAARCLTVRASMGRYFGQTSFCAVFSRMCGVLSLLVFFFSLLLLYWQLTWFTGVLLLGFMFLVGETTEKLLAALRRIESYLARQEGGAQNGNKCDRVEQSSNPSSPL